MSYYPLTKGLLVSMATRRNHAFSLSQEVFPFMEEFNNKDKIELIEDCYKFWKGIHTLGPNAGFNFPDIDSKRMLEEMIGEGFYHPYKEKAYAKSWPADFNPDWIKGKA